MLLMSCSQEDTDFGGISPSIETVTLPTPKPTNPDSELVNSLSCASPCWEEIRPGISSKEEVVSILDQLIEVEQVAKFSSNQNVIVVEFPGSGGSVNIIFEDGSKDSVVTYLAINYGARDQISVSMLIDQFGAPEAYASNSLEELRIGEQINYSCEEWDLDQAYPAVTESGYFLYPANGYTFTILKSTVYSGMICPETRVVVAYYYSPKSLQAALENGDPIIGKGNRNFTQEDMISWHGYGSGY